MTACIDYDGNYGFVVGRTYTCVRGGGAAGGRAWVAQITGYDSNSKWKLLRRFCARDTSDLNGSGRSGRIRFAVDEPGLYEYANFAYKRNRGCRANLIRSCAPPLGRCLASTCVEFHANLT